MGGWVGGWMGGVDVAVHGGVHRSGPKTKTETEWISQVMRWVELLEKFPSRFMLGSGMIGRHPIRPSSSHRHPTLLDTHTPIHSPVILPSSQILLGLSFPTSRPVPSCPIPFRSIYQYTHMRCQVLSLGFGADRRYCLHTAVPSC